MTMNFLRKAKFYEKFWIGILAISFVLALSHTISAQEHGLGGIPLDELTYQRYLKILTVEALPISYDARDDGIVTPPKEQGTCGSCWAFASVGAFESHLLKEFGVGPIDLSEQQQVSCNYNMSGCCGGRLSALQWWSSYGPIEETCFTYGELGTRCPPYYRTLPCEDASRCGQLPYRVIDFHTINTLDPKQVKTSLYNDAPSYFGYDFYDDFRDFWHDGNPGDVYVNAHGTTKLGGHAVLIIGWSAPKGAYLCKNSHGSTSGPNGDGTFWIAYRGHAHDLNFQMGNFNLLDIGIINGTVTDAETGDLIKGAFVIAINADTKDKDNAFTDSNGDYEIPVVLPGTYWVIGLKKGYQADIAKIEVEPGTVTPCNFKLKPKLE